MSAFDIATGTLFADTNMAVSALFVPQIGSAVSLHVILTAPDDYHQVGSSTIDAPTMMLAAKVADCPVITQGDQFIVNSVTYTVQGEPRRDPLQLIWQIDVVAP